MTSSAQRRLARKLYGLASILYEVDAYGSGHAFLRAALGADPASSSAASARGRNGETRLIAAARAGDAPLCERLLSCFDVNARDNFGCSALDAALLGAHGAVAVLLRSCGAVEPFPWREVAASSSRSAVPALSSYVPVSPSDGTPAAGIAVSMASAVVLVEEAGRGGGREPLSGTHDGARARVWPQGRLVRPAHG